MILRTIFIIVCLAGSVFYRACAQNVAIKTNALYWMTTTTNAGAEIVLSNKTTLELSAAYNPWTFKDNKKLRFLLVQPEAKYWFCEKFEGHFVGFHAHAAQFYSTLATAAATAIWQEQALATATTGFCSPTSTLRQSLAWATLICGIRRATVSPA